MPQTNEQAHHAFSTYPWVNVFGMVIALGDCWVYREYYRKDLRLSQSPTLSERLDPTVTFMGTNKDFRKSETMPKTYGVVEEIFGPSGFARLQTKESDKALVAVRKRLMEFAKKMFY